MREVKKYSGVSSFFYLNAYPKMHIHSCCGLFCFLITPLFCKFDMLTSDQISQFARSCGKIFNLLGLRFVCHNLPVKECVSACGV